jgi:hypothetical protein|tara:strand:+ start:884 stop:1264 length:381 start_codon:yes stop_codon:yes gene_type:complete
MIRTRTISMGVNKMVGETFDAIIQLFPKLMPDAKINSDGWWSFIGPYGKSKVKFNPNKPLGILDHEYVDEESSWNTSMRIIPNGDFSEVIIILKKPEQLTDSQFDQRVEKISELATSMKKILESNI